MKHPATGYGRPAWRCWAALSYPAETSTLLADEPSGQVNILRALYSRRGNLHKPRAADFEVQASPPSGASPSERSLLGDVTVRGSGGSKGMGWEVGAAQKSRQTAGQTATTYSGPNTAPRQLSLGPSRSQYRIRRPKLSTWTTKHMQKRKTNHFQLSSHFQLQPMPALFHSAGFEVCRSHERMGAKQWPKRAIQLAKEPDFPLGPPQLPCVVVKAAGTARDLLISSSSSCRLPCTLPDWEILQKAEQAASNN